MASQDRNIFRLSLCPSSYDSVEPSSFVSFSVEHKHGRSLDSLRGIWMCLTSGVYGVYHVFPGGPAFLTRHRASTSTHRHFAFGLCCHSNETRAPTANPPNENQILTGWFLALQNPDEPPRTIFRLIYMMSLAVIHRKWLTLLTSFIFTTFLF